MLPLKWGVAAPPGQRISQQNVLLDVVLWLSELDVGSQDARRPHLTIHSACVCLELVGRQAPRGVKAPELFKRPEDAQDARHGSTKFDKGNPASSSAAVGRLNANGDALSSRQHYAVVKQEKGWQSNEHANEKIEAEVTGESLETKKEGLDKKANTDVQNVRGYLNP
eukprot:jgi/Undpi1/7929/HiC_scaffold_24.g10401.m1